MMPNEQADATSRPTLYDALQAGRRYDALRAGRRYTMPYEQADATVHEQDDDMGDGAIQAGRRCGLRCLTSRPIDDTGYDAIRAGRMIRCLTSRPRLYR